MSVPWPRTIEFFADAVEANHSTVQKQGGARDITADADFVFHVLLQSSRRLQIRRQRHSVALRKRESDAWRRDPPAPPPRKSVTARPLVLGNAECLNRVACPKVAARCGGSGAF